MTEAELQRANLLSLQSILTRKVRRRERASEAVKRLLSGLGVEVYGLKVNKGYWSHATQDVFRWEFWGRKVGTQVPITGGSYSSMKDVQKANRLDWVGGIDDGEVSA